MDLYGLIIFVLTSSIGEIIYCLTCMLVVLMQDMELKNIQVYGSEITIGTVNRIKDAICNYKNENEGEWDTDGCLDAATEQLKVEGYEVFWVNETAEICF